jgi:two-component system response regulator FixJ
MKAGAVDFIEKPFDEAAMLQSIERALEIGKHAQDQFAATRSARSAIERLTPRERDVLGHLVDGHPNKIIAYRLGISPRTVEIHRARIMQKCRVRSLSELVRTALAARQS